MIASRCSLPDLLDLRVELLEEQADDATERGRPADVLLQRREGTAIDTRVVERGAERRRRRLLGARAVRRALRRRAGGDERTPDRVRERRQRHRFGDKLVHTGFLAAFVVLTQRVCGDGDDRDPRAAALLPLADRAGCLKAVHDRHLTVHQHGVVFVVRERVDRLLPVLDGGGAKAEPRRLAHQHLLIDGVVLGDQHPQAAEIPGGGLGRLRRG